MKKCESVGSAGHITEEVRRAIARTTLMLEQDWSDFENEQTHESSEEIDDGDDDSCSIAFELRHLAFVQNSIRDELAEADDCYLHNEQYSFGNESDISDSESVQSWWLRKKADDEGSIATALTHATTIGQSEVSIASMDVPLEGDFSTVPFFKVQAIPLEVDRPMSFQDPCEVIPQYSFQLNENVCDSSTYRDHTLINGMDDQKMSVAMATNLLAFQLSRHVQRRFVVRSDCSGRHCVENCSGETLAPQRRREQASFGSRCLYLAAE